MEVIGDAGSDAEVVLAVVISVGDAGVDVVDLDGVDSPPALDAGADAASAEEAERLAIDVEAEVDVFLGTAEEGFAEGHPAAVITVGVSPSEEVIEKLSGFFDAEKSIDQLKQEFA